MNKLFFSVFFAVIAAELISAATYSAYGTYEMRYANGLGGGFLSGTAYYHYDSSNVKNTLIVYKHNVKGSEGSVTITEFENYTSPASMFKICPGSCEGSMLSKDPEPWWRVSGDTVVSGDVLKIDGVNYVRHNRNGQKKGNIKALYLKEGSSVLTVPTDPSQMAIKIIFNDGREVTFAKGSMKATTKSNSAFSIPSGVNCPVKACRSYLDIMFVLDESGSISSSEFSIIKTFVTALVGNLTIARDAANIGVVTFNSNAVLQFDLTYTNVAGKIQNIAQRRGGTRQGLGLGLAKTYLIDRNWRTPLYGKPTQFVIALTDGEDARQSEVESNANLLKNNGVFLIEVGVGITDKYAKILEGYASKLNGESGYFNVKNFDALLAKINDLVVPICETSNSSSCDPKCNGYCGCGMKCYCPTCPTSNSKCESYSCSVVGATTAGCTKKTVTCNDNLHCTTDTCNANTGCVFKPKTCKPQFTCQTSVCSETLQGGCSVKNVDSKCPDYGQPCYEKHCDPTHTGADSNTGCYYTYSCVGQFPVSYDNKGNYKSGCYAYSCDKNSKKCMTSNVCSEMSNECTKYECDTNKGMCVMKKNVTCPEVDGCVIESKCNPVNGKCDVKYNTVSDCEAAFRAEAKLHVGTNPDDWFATEANIDSYYTCGETSCQVTPPSPVDTKSRTQNGHCVFAPGTPERCGACSGQYAGQPTFRTCQDEANERHNKKNTSCFVSTCVAVTTDTSKCEITEIKCEKKPCQSVVCNMETLKCDYEEYPSLVDLRKNNTECQEARCLNDEAVLVDLVPEKCLGENGVKVPVCKKYDSCDAQTGCVYVDKCVRVNNCTTMTCDNTTNTCVEKPKVCEESDNVCIENICNKKTDECEPATRNVDEACGTTDLCHYYECSVENNTCFLIDVEFPNETDVCHNYTCHNDTGLWTVVEKCDDSRLCTIDECAFDGQCTHRPNQCEDSPKINMSCFFWSCSENRKNGCYKRIYDNAYFDECGNCIGPYDDEKNKTDNPDYSECKKALTWEEKAAVISAGVAGAIVAACVIGAIGVSVGGTLLTRELIKRARAAADSGAVENPMYQDNGREMSNPAFEGEEMDS